MIDWLAALDPRALIVGRQKYPAKNARRISR
jgi:hypothetical protein